MANQTLRAPDKIIASFRSKHCTIFSTPLTVICHAATMKIDVVKVSKRIFGVCEISEKLMHAQTVDTRPGPEYKVGSLNPRPQPQVKGFRG